MSENLNGAPHPDRRRSAAPRVLRIGPREVLAEGLRPNIFADLYHLAMTIGWPVFFAAAAAIFLVVNLAFAALYWLGDDPIANARPGVFLDYFFFSVETFATVGYGDMHPRTTYGHVVAAIGAFVGVSSLAVTTGLMFTRFSRPRARLLFARNPVIAPRDGRRTLMIRFANARHNMIADASAKLWVVRNETTAEGVVFRSFRRLDLVRDESPVFALTWTIMHVIDEVSPLYGASEERFVADGEFGVTFVVVIAGHDETSSIAVHARHNYSGAEVLFDHEYVDIMRVDDSGRMRIEFGKFHDTRPLAQA
jgi:inward rectifier potassium channel